MNSRIENGDGYRGFRVRPWCPGDREAVLSLAPRLTVGRAPWLNGAAFLAAARRWVEGSMQGIGPERAVFVSESAAGQVVGFVSVSRIVHFTSESHAYIGELAVAAAAEGRGIGGALVAAAEGWARDGGYRVIALDTGAANARARGFYAHRGYAEESVKLAQVL